jgi:hypothetical protein
MCVTAHGGVRNGALIDTYQCIGQSNQRWYISQAGTVGEVAKYRIQPPGSIELCVQAPSSALGTQLRLAGCGAKSTQLIVLYGDNLTDCQISREESLGTKVASVKGGFSRNNTPVIVWKMTGAADQMFNLNPV